LAPVFLLELCFAVVFLGAALDTAVFLAGVFFAVVFLDAAEAGFDRPAAVFLAGLMGRGR
jgi:hypothetical protein